VRGEGHEDELDLAAEAGLTDVREAVDERSDAREGDERTDVRSSRLGRTSTVNVPGVRRQDQLRARSSPVSPAQVPCGPFGGAGGSRSSSGGAR